MLQGLVDTYQVGGAYQVGGRVIMSFERRARKNQKGHRAELS